ncbi:hypothetical protein BKA93DRAFT_827765 [Sparassis latifolia]|uniref:Transmembrane protein n=1 Tax=Sparassis crispa TaxID=139825 RepID=A0A401GFZ2_9APHY|nr:hypothetical protein SCP_0307460 [Sparassis crispa]GBE81023.1 hypothetical protein SCP_0307460 [Sparassis crispa]
MAAQLYEKPATLLHPSDPSMKVSMEHEIADVGVPVVQRTKNTPLLDPTPARSLTLPLFPSPARSGSDPLTQPTPDSVQSSQHSTRSQTFPPLISAGLSTELGSQIILTPFTTDSSKPFFENDSVYAEDMPKVAPNSADVSSVPSNEMRSRFHAGMFIPNRGEDSSLEPYKRPARYKAAWSLLDGIWRGTCNFVVQHWILTIVVSILAIVGIGVGVGWAARLQTFNAEDGESVPPDNAIILSANLVDVDPTSQTMTLDWFVNYTCDFSHCQDVNIFFDQNSMQSNSNSGSVASNSKPSPLFLLNGTNFVNLWNSVDFRPSSLVFRTDLSISSYGTGRTEQSYPFDKYLAQISIFAEALPGNETVNVTVYQTQGIAVGFNAQLLDSGKIDEFGTLYKFIEVTRGQVVRIYTIFIVMAIWLVTLTFIGACATSVFYGKGMSAAVLVLPVATLFAFTQLRGTLPGAPAGFGADIDFVGILPCLALLTFCSVFMTAVFLFRNPEVDSARWQSARSV